MRVLDLNKTLFSVIFLVLLFATSGVVAEDFSKLKMQYNVDPVPLTDESIHEVEVILGYRFKQKMNLYAALMVDDQNPASAFNRLEFAGDKALDAAFTSIFMQRFPRISAGELTEARDALLRQESLAAMGLYLNLYQYIYLGEGKKTLSIVTLADTLEAIVGAIYMDGDQESVDRFFQRHFMPMVRTERNTPINNLIAKASRDLKIHFHYHSRPDGSFVISTNLKENGLKYRGSPPKISRKKANPDRLAIYLAERNYVLNILPTFKYSLISLPIDPDYIPAPIHDIGILLGNPRLRTRRIFRFDLEQKYFDQIQGNISQIIGSDLAWFPTERDNRGRPIQANLAQAKQVCEDKSQLLGIPLRLPTKNELLFLLESIGMPCDQDGTPIVIPDDLDYRWGAYWCDSNESESYGHVLAERVRVTVKFGDILVGYDSLPHRVRFAPTNTITSVFCVYDPNQRVESRWPLSGCSVQ